MIHKLYEYRDKDIYIHHAIDKVPTDDDYPMHAHSTCEILGFIKGKCSYVIEGSKYKLEPGCIMLMRPSEAHKLHINIPETYERIMINFDIDLIKQIDSSGKLLEAFMDRPLGQFNMYRMHEFSSVSGISYLREMISAVSTCEEQRLNVITNLYPLLNSLKSIFLFKKSNEVEWINRDTPRLIIDYVNDHLHEDLSLSLLSEQFFLSKSQISRIFKKSTGSSVLDYITIKRLMRARESIINGGTAADASHKCGFYNYSSFYRAYKKRFNVSPSSLKKPAK